MRHIVVDKAPPHKRLDLYLTHVLPELSRTRIQHLIKEGHIRLQGKEVKASYRVSPGEHFTIEIPPLPPSDLKPEDIPLSILHEDERLIVINKPAGMVVHPAPGHLGGTLVNALLAHGTALSSAAGPFKPGIVHRLDKDTSGVMVVAKDDAAHWELSRQFASRKVKRVYLALVKGRVAQEEGTIQAPIGRHPKERKKMTVRLVGRSKEAITRYRVLKRFLKETYLELYPQTGRTHQLRVHLAHVGHPILGDIRYGVKAELSRQALHAYQLGFSHPADHRFMTFTAPVPQELTRAIKMLAQKKIDMIH